MRPATRRIIPPRDAHIIPLYEGLHPCQVVAGRGYFHRMGETMTRIAAWILFALALLLFVSWYTDTEEAYGASPDTLRIQLPTMDNTGTCAAPILSATTETSLRWALYRGPLDTVATGQGAPSSFFDWATPLAWPVTGTRVYVVVIDDAGNKSCPDSAIVRGRDSRPPSRAAISVR